MPKVPDPVTTLKILYKDWSKNAVYITNAIVKLERGPTKEIQKSLNGDHVS